MLALIVQGMHPFRIKIDTRILVPDQRIVFPTVPQTFSDFEKFVDAPVASGLVRNLVETIILRFFDVVPGHDIPSDTTATDMVECGKAPN